MNVNFSANNRNPIRNYFITFPKCNGSKEDFVHKVFPKENVNRCSVFEEKHEDGSPHYHLIIQLNKGIPWKKVVDLYVEHYPNDYKRIQIQKMRKEYDTASLYLTDPKKVKYIDPSPYVYGLAPVGRSELRKRRIMKIEGLTSDEEYDKWLQDMIDFDRDTMERENRREQVEMQRQRDTYVENTMSEYERCRENFTIFMGDKPPCFADQLKKLIDENYEIYKRKNFLNTI